MALPHKRSLGFLVLAVGAATAFVGGPSAGHAGPRPAAPPGTHSGDVAGTVNTGGGELNVRAGASTSTAILGRLPDRSAVTISCQVSGQQIRGHVRTTTMWDRLSDGRYVSDAYIDRGVSVRTCPPPGQSPAPSPSPKPTPTPTEPAPTTPAPPKPTPTPSTTPPPTKPTPPTPPPPTPPPPTKPTPTTRPPTTRPPTTRPPTTQPPAAPEPEAPLIDLRPGMVDGTASTGGGPLNVRANASTTSAIVGTVPDRSALEISCQLPGQQISGWVRSTNLWNRLTDGRYVSDAYVQRPQLVDVCPAEPTPPPATPPTPPPSSPPPAPPAGGSWVAPAPGWVGQRFRPPSNPWHDGVDMISPRGTTIRAISGGTVITVTCNTSGPNCDTDGSLDIRGCGWYVEIQHPGQVISRYCHMLRRPSVNEGQQVVTGQVIGYVGSSGNSSGPHLHFEVHIGAPPARRATAVDPVTFMRNAKAPLAERR